MSENNQRSSTKVNIKLVNTTVSGFNLKLSFLPSFLPHTLHLATFLTSSYSHSNLCFQGNMFTSWNSNSIQSTNISTALCLKLLLEKFNSPLCDVDELHKCL